MIIRELLKRYVPVSAKQFLRRFIKVGRSKARKESNIWLKYHASDINGHVLSIGSGTDEDHEGGHYRNYFKNCLSYTTSEVTAEFKCDVVLDVRSIPEIQDESLDEFLQRGNFVNVATPLFRRDWLDHIGGWDPSATVHDDQDIMLRLAYSGAEGHFLDGEPVLLYRRRRVPFDPAKHETWRSSVIKFKGQAYVWDKLRRAMLDDGRPEWPLVERRMGFFEFCTGWWYYRGGDRKSAVGWMLKRLRHNRQRPLYKFIFLVSAIFLPSSWLWGMKHWFVGLANSVGRWKRDHRFAPF